MARLLRVAHYPGGDLPRLEPAATRGEWALPGAFNFWGLAEPQRDERFRHGFFAPGSQGWASLVEVAHIDAGDLDRLRLCLARHLVQRHGAPGLGAACGCVEQEIAHAQTLCQASLGTLLTVERRLDGDHIHEDYHRVRIATPPIDHGAVRIWGADAAAGAD